MSAAWYDADWSYRAVALVNRTGTSGAKDVELTILPQHQHFWTNVDTNGEDIRVTDATGEVLLTFDLDGFNKTNQVGELEIQAYAGRDLAQQIIYIYYGATGKSTGVTTFTPSTPIGGAITPEQPTAPILRLFPERPGDPNPRVVVSKHASATAHYTIPLPDNLAANASAYNGHLGFDGWDYFTFVVTSSGTADGALISNPDVRIMDEGAQGERLSLRVIVKGGTTGTNYTGVLTLTSTSGRIEVLTFEIRVLTPVETS
jgi:hypothetical protein